MALYEKLTATSTPAEIAAAYKEFTGLVGGDTQSAQERAVDYLTGLGIAAPTITQAYSQFLQPAALSSSQIADTSGVGSQGIGVDTALPTAGALTQATNTGATVNQAATTSEAAPLYQGLTSSSTPAQIASAYSQLAEGAGGDTQYNQEQAVAYLQKLGVPDATITQAYQQYLQPVETETIYINPLNNLTSVDNVALAQGLSGGSTSIPGAENTLDKITNQILGQGFTDKWTGEGFGSAEKNAADMARLLTSIGITDINQFGKVTVAADAEVKPVFDYRTEVGSEGELIQVPILKGYVDANGKAVDPSLVTQSYDSEGMGAGVYTAPVGTKEVFGNKVTGQALDPQYDRAQGNIFSGTFAGKGSTGYGVQFKEDGTPVFYTQYGGSTNTLNQIMSDLGPLGQIAFAVATGGLSIPQQIAAQAALSLASGTDLKDIVKNIAVSTVLQGVPTSGIIKEGASFLNTLDDTGVLGKVFTSAASSATKAALTDQDISDAILSGAIGGATSGAVDMIASNIEGFSSLTPSQQNMVKNAVSGVTSGQPLDQVLINTAIAAGKDAVSSAVKDNTALNAFVDAKRTGASDADALAASDALTKIAEANETFDGSGFDTQDEAMNAAIANGLDKFTFGGKKFTIDNSAAQIKDFENYVAADLAEKAKTDPEFGDLAGAIKDATARNTVAIGNAEADNVDEAAYLAKVRDPSATSFTFGGKTYTIGASQSQMAEATRNATLAEIKDLPNFKDAYARARETLGPNQTFEWNGKQYSTATAAERPDLSAPKVQAPTDESAAETARLNRLNTSLVTGNAPDQSAAETARLKSMEKTGFFESLYKDLNDKFKLQGEAANKYLKDNPNSPITASVSSAFDALGELQRGAGGIALAFDNKPLADAIINSGDKLQKLGQSLGSAPEDTKNWNDTINLIDKAKGAEKLAVLAGRIMDGTSGLARQVGLELRQELPALFLGGGLLRPTMVASGLIDTADTAGNAVVDAYDEVIKNKGNHQEGLSAGRKAGAAAGATEAAIQLTLGKLADVAAGKLDNIISKGTTKVAGEGVVEGSQEAGASAAVDVALGNAIDVNKALTQGVLGAAVGKGTAATTSPVDAATASTVTEAASTASNTAAANIANNINTAISSGDTQNLGLVITENVASSIDSGASANVVVDAAVTTAINGGADASVAVDSAITSAINSGASVDTTIGSAVTSAVKAGADVNTVIQAATTAAANTGNNVTIVSNANTVTINNATTNTNTTVDTATGVTTTVDNNTNTTTAVDGNTTTTVDSNTSTQTTVDTNTNTTTSTTVDTNTNTTTQTTITGNTQTTVLTDPNTNTQTTVKVNTDTGEVEEVKETEIPADWEQPEIKLPITPEVIPPTAVPEVTTDNTSKPKKLDEKGGAGGIGGAGLPLGIGVDPASLRSKVTGDAIDPLARVKQAQAELEREVMMNQFDPRFLSVIQQRMDPQQQTQQFESDIGALARLLGGETEAPANENQYYSYGSEDSIDDILGGRAANYAAGGYVEPLKASGGSMALPLLAKSGGALDKYNGREDFKQGKHVAGDGDGQSDDIPAWLADGEFVIPADVVSALGNGSTKAGTDKLYEMMHSIRDRARSKGPKDLPPPALKSPLDYLKSSKRSAK